MLVRRNNKNFAMVITNTAGRKTVVPFIVRDDGSDLDYRGLWRIQALIARIEKVTAKKARRHHK